MLIPAQALRKRNLRADVRGFEEAMEKAASMEKESEILAKDLSTLKAKFFPPTATQFSPS